MPPATVLLTGASKGIGLAAAKAFLASGHQVIALARNFAHFELAAAGRLETISFDLREVAAIPDLVASLPPIDILINNAGIMHALPYEDYPTDKVKEILAVNLEAPVALIREASKAMVSRGRGRIVNNASIAGQIGHPDVWYGITKAGLINMTKSFAKLLGPQGVVVNAVAAGPVETEMLAVIPEARKKAIKEAVYTGRFAAAEEVAAAIYWLATDCPEYINGTCLDINNGAFPR